MPWRRKQRWRCFRSRRRWLRQRERRREDGGERFGGRGPGPHEQECSCACPFGVHFLSASYGGPERGRVEIARYDEGMGRGDYMGMEIAGGDGEDGGQKQELIGRTGRAVEVRMSSSGSFDSPSATLRAAQDDGVKQQHMQIPPLRCGMTNDNRQSQVLRLRRSR